VWSVVSDRYLHGGRLRASVRGPLRPLSSCNAASSTPSGARASPTCHNTTAPATAGIWAARILGIGAGRVGAYGEPDSEHAVRSVRTCLLMPSHTHRAQASTHTHTHYIYT
jgi:hypothetical protein